MKERLELIIKKFKRIKYWIGGWFNGWVDGEIWEITSSYKTC